MSTAQPKKRTPKQATVLRTERLTRDLVRVHLTGDDIADMPPLEYTDSYVKLLFAPEGASYSWPFDPEEIRETRPREEWPVTRTYTVRHLDPETGTMAVDFVVHGPQGLAGPWAGSAKPGDTIGFMGPGGAWKPREDANLTILAGDESALPAIAAALDAMPHEAKVAAFVEVADESTQLSVRQMPGLDLTWVHRGESAYGVPLAHAVREGCEGLTDVEKLSVFVHGNAEMIKELRRLFIVDLGVDREWASISGYWRTGYTEDEWQSSKREFVAQMEAEQGA